ncbi:MAG: M48 family metallopeptidase [Candidatus Aenigmarchaeota archaeon]|nr:M48 family metallopeptidase [Candidatus Aenigmarchaeota archaeon]
MKKISFHEQIEKNKRDSLVLSFFVFLSLLFIIYFFSIIFFPGYTITVLFFGIIFSLLYVLNGWLNGDKIVLAATGAKPAVGKKYIQLNNVVEELSIAAGIPKPKIYVIESNEMNAFATGRDPHNSSIAITTGLLEKLNRDELSGVIAHEMSHISNYDIRFSMIVATVVGLVVILSHTILRSFRFRTKGKNSILIIFGILFVILAPIIVRLIHLAISRKREYLADSTAVKLTRYPEGLASALEKIMKTNKGELDVSDAVSHMFFVDPSKNVFDELAATHPPIEERIKILRSM